MEFIIYYIVDASEKNVPNPCCEQRTSQITCYFLSFKGSIIYINCPFGEVKSLLETILRTILKLFNMQGCTVPLKTSVL